MPNQPTVSGDYDPEPLSEHKAYLYPSQKNWKVSVYIRGEYGNRTKYKCSTMQGCLNWLEATYPNSTVSMESVPLHTFKRGT